jgi:MFS family permease
MALMGLLAFLIAVFLEHLLASSLDPLRHQISEYVNSSSGPLMVLGFLLWALSLLATGLLTERCWGDRLLLTLLSVAALGIVVVALFPTETSAGELPAGSSLTTGGQLHNLGSGLTSLALLAAAVISILNFRRDPLFRRRTMLLMSGALAASLVLLLIGPSVGGLRQRLVLFIGCYWQLLLLRNLGVQLRRP